MFLPLMQASSMRPAFPICGPAQAQNTSRSKTNTRTMRGRSAKGSDFTWRSIASAVTRMAEAEWGPR